MNESLNTLIESLGVYLPPKTYSTSEVLEGCETPIRFPLEKITGIENRRMAGEKEFSIDLARKAVADCLAKSKYGPKDIDLLICCNISKFDGPEMIAFEPNSSVQLRKEFAFENAIVLDITNACAGMFTGIYLVNALLKAGTIRRAMVVSGEYITFLTKSAQKEIESYMDTRLACLTLGDAGAAMILEQTPDKNAGFQEIDLRTFGRYSPYCIAKESEHGNWIMYTDSVNLTDVAIKSGAKNALKTMERAGWPNDGFQHILMHQTSRTTLNSGKREMNTVLKGPICHDGNTINNLKQRGNTASTTHWVAIADKINDNHIQSGDKIVFTVSASGLTVGTALYVFDDLPDRMRNGVNGKKNGAAHHKVVPSQKLNGVLKKQPPRVRVESIGTLPENAVKVNSLDSLTDASRSCIEQSRYAMNDIGLLIYTGVYREEYLMEPAYAALLAGKLDMNASLSEAEGQKTLAFDIFNGAIGFMNGCYLAQQLIAANKCSAAMIVASESENNAREYPDKLVGLRETASAIILDTDPRQSQGFSTFTFSYDLDSIDAYQAYCSTRADKPLLIMEKVPDLEEKYIAAILPVVEDLMRKEGLELNGIDKIFPPQISSGFITRLSEALGLPRAKFVDVVGDGADLYSSSVSYAMKHAFENGEVKPGDKGLVIAAGSGIQIAGAIYHF